MENIVAVSIKIDDTHKAIIFPSGTNPFQNSDTEIIDGKTFYLNKRKIDKQYFSFYI